MALTETTAASAVDQTNKPLLKSNGISTIDPSAFLQHKIDAVNENTGALKYYDCPDCRNKGYIAYAKDGVLCMRDCACMAKRQSLRLIENSGLSDSLEERTFEAFQTPEPWLAEGKAKAMDFVENHKGKWFLAAGSPGCGKTHLCTAICGKFLSNGIPVRYMLWLDVCGRLKACVNDSEEFERIINPLKRVPVLYIDDLFKTQKEKKPTPADVSVAFEILNSRYADRKKTTIISTEKSPEKLCDIDEAVGSRIYERCKGNIWSVEGDGKNWRLRRDGQNICN